MEKTEIYLYLRKFKVTVYTVFGLHLTVVWKLVSINPKMGTNLNKFKFKLFRIQNMTGK
jgi:hypothetical protein